MELQSQKNIFWIRECLPTLIFFFHGDCAQMIYFLARSHGNYSALHENTSWDFLCAAKGVLPMWALNINNSHVMYGQLPLSLSLSLLLAFHPFFKAETQPILSDFKVIYRQLHVIYISDITWLLLTFKKSICYFILVVKIFNLFHVSMVLWYVSF